MVQKRLYRNPLRLVDHGTPTNQTLTQRLGDIQISVVFCIAWAYAFAVIYQQGGAAVKAKRVALYGRVSTDKQTTAQQINELRAAAERHGWQVVGEFIDHGISGAKGRDQRPQLDALLKAASRREFDVVAAWSVDRLGRSLQHLVVILAEFQGKGIDLYLHQQQLDTATPSGKALFQMCGVFAEFERSMIQERVKAGMARAMKHGTRSGQAVGRPRVGGTVEARVKALRRKGKGILAIAREVGCGTGTVQRIVASA